MYGAFGVSRVGQLVFGQVVPFAVFGFAPDAAFLGEGQQAGRFGLERGKALGVVAHDGDFFRLAVFVGARFADGDGVVGVGV